MRTLHHDYADQGFVVLGFPCNQFGKQEPGTDAEILEFVTSKFDVDFPMFSKIDVNGETAAPLYKFLTSAAPNAEGAEAISWNFEKFLIGRDGETITRFGPQTTPEEVAALLPDHL